MGDHPIESKNPKNKNFSFERCARKASHPTTNSQWRKVPRGNAHDFLELIGSVAADYTPRFMNQS